MTNKKRITKQLLTMVLTASLVVTSVLSVPHLSFAEESDILTEDTSSDAVACEETSDVEAEEDTEEAEVEEETDVGESDDSSEDVSSEEESTQDPDSSEESENPEDEAEGADDANDAEETGATDDVDEEGVAEEDTTPVEEIQPEEVIPEVEEIEATEELEEEEEETVEESSYPAQNFGPKSISSVTVEASVDEGVFPEGTEMVVSSVSSHVTEQIKEAANDLTDESEEVIDVIAVDISFVCDGAEIQPEDGSVRVEMRTERTVEGDNHKVVHFDGGDAEIVASASADSASLDADSFSVYAIVGTEYKDEEVKAEARYFYEFYVGDTCVDTQIIKNGDVLTEPSVPDSDKNKEFTGWRISGESENMTFGNAITVEGEEDKHIRVKAHFEDYFKVTFYTSDDKSSILQNVTVKDGETVSTKDQILPGDDLHMFDGWYNAADASKEKVEEVIVSGEDVELLPIFKEGIWVRFESNGGSYVKPEFIMPNETVEVPEDPERTGYAFTGWYTTEELRQKFDFSESITETTTLYASWKAINVSYKVAHWQENADDDGYTLVSVEEKSAECGSIVDAEYAREKRFIKTYPHFAYEEELTRDVTINADGSSVVNIYYKRARFTIRYFAKYEDRANGVAPRVFEDVKYMQLMDEVYEEIKDIYDPNTQYSRLYYNIGYNQPSLPWDRCTNSFIDYYERTGNTIDVFMATMDLPDKKQRYVEYKEGDTIPEGADCEEREGKLYYLKQEQSIKCSGITICSPHKITGYTPFCYVCADGREFNIPVGTAPETHYPCRPGVNKFYFYKTPWSVMFNVAGGEAVPSITKYYEDRLSDCKPASYEKLEVDKSNLDTATKKVENGKDYYFMGWYTDETMQTEFDFDIARMPDGNLLLHAKWEPISYTVEFNPNNGDDISRVTVNAGDKVNKPEDPEKEGAKFVGWKTSDGMVFSFDTQITEDTNLVAEWMNEKTYTVAYDAGEFGSFGKKDLNHYANGAKAFIAGTPIITDKSKKFIGWQIGGNSKLYKAGAFVINEDDADDSGVITLVAQYEDKPELTAITYDPNGHKGKAVTFKDVSQNNDVVKAKSPSDADVNFAAKPGYKFEKWNTEKDGSGESFYPGETIALNNTDGKAAILYAQWVVKDDVLKYNANGGTGTMEDTKGKTFETVKVSANEFSREGYTFTGWNTKADGTGDSYAEDAGYTLTPEDDIVYAQWEANADALKYNANGGTGTMEDTNGKTFEIVKVSVNEFSREGYTFTGWNTKADGTGDSYAEDAGYTLTPEDDIVYAQWKAKSKDNPKDDHKDDPKDDPKDESEEKPEEQHTESSPVVQVVNVSNEVSTTSNARTDSPKTGEETNALPFVGLALGVLGIAVLRFTGKRKKKEL